MITPLRLLKLALLTTGILLSSACARAGSLYRANFYAEFDNVYMPLTHMEASYVFESPILPTEQGDFTASYSLRSASFILNGVLFQSQDGYLRVDNNIPLSTTGPFRDSYLEVSRLSGTFAEIIELHAGGLEFNNVGPTPSAFDSFELPTSVEDLAGFGLSDFRSATLTFRNLELGYWFTASAPIQDLTIVPVPEPGSLSLFALALLPAVVRGVRKHPKVQPTDAPNERHALPF